MYSEPVINKLTLGTTLFVACATWLLGFAVQAQLVSPNIGKVAVAGLWLLLLLACVAFIVSHKLLRVFYKPLLVCAALLLVGLLLPKASINTVLLPANYVLDQLAALLGSWGRFVPSAGKVGHVLVFAGLTLCLVLIGRRIGIAAVWFVVFLLIVAVATEGLQLLVPSRTTRLFDVGFDAVGIGFGVFLGRMLAQKFAISRLPAV